MSDKMPTPNAGESSWDKKEFDWQDKSFYFVSITTIFGVTIGLGSKLELLMRDVRKEGYKIVNNTIYIQTGALKGRAMLEIEPQELSDSQVTVFDTPTTTHCMVVAGGVGPAVAKLTERVASKTGRKPNQLYYVYVPGGSPKTTVLAIT